jgi:hypothetical protein
MDAHDHGPVPDDPIRFREAIDRFRQLVPMTDEQYAALEEAEQEFAFTVADVAQADLVAEVYDAIDRAISDGTTFEDFQGDVGGGLADAWGGEDAGRLDTIFRTNVMDAYSSGRYDVMTAPAVAEARPYWRFDAVGDGARTCDICEPCDGTILPQDHPWWQRHYPILHPNCSCIATPLSEDEARDEGISDDGPDVDPADGFGAPPAGAGGSDWEPDTSDYPAAVRDELDDRLDAEDDAA